MRWSVWWALGVVVSTSACATVTVLDERQGSGGNGDDTTGGAAPVPSASSGPLPGATVTTGSGAGDPGATTSSGAGGGSSGELSVLATGLTQPQAVATAGELVYVTEFGFASGDGSLARVPKHGGVLDRVVPFEDGPFGLAVGTDHVYWSVYGQPGDGALKRLRLADDSVTVLAAGLSQPLGIAWDQGTVYAAEHDGGRVLAVEMAGDLDVVASSQGFPYAVAPASGGVVYATQRTLAEPAVVRRVAGGQIVDLYANLAPVRSMASDGPAIYLGTDAGEILRGTIDGEPLTTLAVVNDRVFGLAVADGFVYFTAFAQGVVGRIPSSGGDAQTLATDQGLVRGVTVDGDAIYWVREDVDQTESSGSLVKLTK